MPQISCDSCRAIFASNEDNEGLADLLEASHPKCACEAFSVGEGSPGVVNDQEILLRIIISPRDIDRETGEIAVRPFEKAFKNGLSVVRSVASDSDIDDIVNEGLEASGVITSKVEAILGATTLSVRSITKENEKVFCVYDQTVKRRDETRPPIPTHAGVFQRHPPKGIAHRKLLQKDFARLLYQTFLDGQLPLRDFRDGRLVDARPQSEAEVISLSSYQNDGRSS